MGLDKGSIDEALAAPTVCGTPYHGLVQDGVLVLPNAVAMAYPQPAGTSIKNSYGDTHHVVVPGTPAIVRTPEQAAADAAAGHDWRSTATLSGARQQLYGQPLDGWIYIDPAGERWRVQPSIGEYDDINLYAPLSFSVRLTRFGEIRPGGVDEYYDYPVTIADLQQGAAPLNVFGAAVTAGRLHINGIRSDGSAAALMIFFGDQTVRYETVNFLTELENLPGRLPLGWIQITISGAGAAASVAASVLYSRDQTLEVSTQTAPQVTWQAGWYYKTDSFGVVTEWLPYNAEIRPPPPDGTWLGPATRNYPVAEYEDIERRTSAIIGVWPNGASWSVVRRVVRNLRSAAAPAMATMAATPYETSTRTTVMSESVEFSIEVDGVPISTIVCSGTRTRTAHTRYLPSGGGDDYESWADNQDAYEIGEQSFTDTSSEYATWSAPDVNSIWSSLGAPIGINARGGAISGGLYTQQAAAIAGTGLVIVSAFSLAQYAAGSRSWLQEVRYSNNLVGLRLVKEWAAASADWTADHYPPVSPSGLHGVKTTLPYRDWLRYYGSWCPQTEQAVWGADEPVCWV